MEQLKYPIGKFEYGKDYTFAESQEHIFIIEKLPEELNKLAAQFTPAKLKNSYRPGGWTAWQIIHHIADSHMNGFIRLKLALTEDNPAIKPYDQDLWAELPDGKTAPVEVSLMLIENIHRRWVYLLKTLSSDDLQRKYIHPEQNRKYKLSELLAQYAWHGRQHCEHLKIILNS